MKNKFLLAALLLISANSFADVVIMIPHTYSVIQFLKTISIKWAAAGTVRSAASNPELLISASEVINAGKSIVAGKIAAQAIETSIEVGTKVKETLEAKLAKSDKEESTEETIETTQVGL